MKNNLFFSFFALFALSALIAACSGGGGGTTLGGGGGGGLAGNWALSVASAGSCTSRWGLTLTANSAGTLSTNDPLIKGGTVSATSFMVTASTTSNTDNCVTGSGSGSCSGNSCSGTWTQDAAHSSVQSAATLTKQ